MVILDVFLVTVGLSVFAVIGTQVLIPLATGTPLFPIRSAWRKKHEDKMTKLHDTAEKIDAEMDEAELEDFIASLRNKGGKKGK